VKRCRPLKEAVAIRRELAAVYPDRHRSDLAGSLTNLGETPTVFISAPTV